MSEIMPGQQEMVPASRSALPGSVVTSSGAPAGRQLNDEPIVAFARDVLDFPLYPRQAAILNETYADDVRTSIYRLGRKSGKGRLAAVLATFEGSANAEAHQAAVPAGERVHIAVISRSQRQARTVHRYIVGFLRSPALRHLLPPRPAADEVELTNGMTIVTLPCHAASVRDIACAVVLLDEVAWWTGLDGSPLNPSEVWNAIVPTTAMFPAGRVVVSSTPRHAAGFYFELCRSAASGEIPGTRHWHASTAEMNPRIPQSFLDAERARDPVAYSREWEANFEATLAAALPSDLVRQASDARKGREELAPVAGVSYLIALDPAWVGDRFALVLGHREQGGRVVVDRVRSWQGSRSAPVSMDAVLDDVALLSQAYGRAPAITDQSAAAPISEGLRKRGVAVRQRAWTNEGKADALTATRRLLMAGQLELPPRRELLEELAMLEVRAMPSGRPRISAPAGRHDDFATCLMALCLELDQRRRQARVMDIDQDGRIFTRYVDQEELEQIKRRRYVAGDGERTKAERREAAAHLDRQAASREVSV